MTIENPTFVIKNYKQRYIIIIAGVVGIMLVSLLDFFEEKQLGLNREVYIVLASLIFVILNVYRFLKDYHYVNFTIHNEKLSLKFYSLRSFSGKRKNIEIPIATLAKYEIRHKLMGQVPYLVLFQKIKGKMAQYPPVSLSAMTKEDINQIKYILEGLLNTRN